MDKMIRAQWPPRLLSSILCVSLPRRGDDVVVALAANRRSIVPSSHSLPSWSPTAPKAPLNDVMRACDRERAHKAHCWREEIGCLAVFSLARGVVE